MIFDNDSAKWQVVTPNITAYPDADRDQQRLQLPDFHPRFFGCKNGKRVLCWKEDANL